jgi:hypothetical protein
MNDHAIILVIEDEPPHARTRPLFLGAVASRVSVREA